MHQEVDHTATDLVLFIRRSGRDPRTLERSSLEGFPSASSLVSESWEKGEIRVLKEGSTKKRGKGGRSERLREKWCVGKKRKEGNGRRKGRKRKRKDTRK